VTCASLALPSWVGTSQNVTRQPATLARAATTLVGTAAGAAVSNGTFRLGPSERFTRCDACGAIDYATGLEANEGDRHDCETYKRTVARLVTELCDIEDELGISELDGG
jgi:hypothetical protein